LGKEAFEKIVIGIDPGVAIGLVEIADGKVIEEGN
jgi:predicted RNase H-like nuclease (RuvC/YqgF family)